MTLKPNDGIISLDPAKYEGRGGFGGIKGVKPTEGSETISDEELGAGIRAALEERRTAAKR